MLSWAAVCMRRAASLFAVLLVTEKELEDRVVSCRAHSTAVLTVL